MNIKISIHALREEGDGTKKGGRTVNIKISIHALREEGDILRAANRKNGKHFYPRPPRGGRRKPTGHRRYEQQFLSTPSARRATFVPSRLLWEHFDFYPRPPRGGRHEVVVKVCGGYTFLSTPSARRATHIPYGEIIKGYHFYPRPPRGGRRVVFAKDLTEQDISIHALREEGDEDEEA